MKFPCEFLAEDIAKLIQAEFKQRKEKLSDPDLPLKLALIAKMGIIIASLLSCECGTKATLGRLASPHFSPTHQ